MVVPGAKAAKEAEVNGVRLQYIEQGSGEPIVFVHGAPHDLRAWEPVREEIAKRYRFIAYKSGPVFVVPINHYSDHRVALDVADTLG